LYDLENKVPYIPIADHVRDFRERPTDMNFQVLCGRTE
jgi:hypothetical protein